MTIPSGFENAIVDHVAHAERQPYNEAMSWFRREAPLIKVQPDGFTPFWAVTKHADIRNIERMSNVFIKGHISPVMLPTVVMEQLMAMTDGQATSLRALTEMDDPDHRKYRHATQLHFMPKSLKKLEAGISELAQEFVDRFEKLEGECDFARDIAFLFPLRVIMQLLGVPKEDEPLMLQLTQEFFASSDPDINPNVGAIFTKEHAQYIMDVRTKFANYFGQHFENRQKSPKDDMLSVIANAKIDGEHMPPLEMLSYAIVIATAGHDTTSASLAAAMWKFCEEPQLLQFMKENPDKIDQFTEEVLRYETPVRHFSLVVGEDTEYNGQSMRKGDLMMLCYPSANLDADVFSSSEKFNPLRSPNDQIAFGYGAHMCLGQYLAKMEMKEFWRAFLPRIKSVEFNGKPQRIQSNFISGPKFLPIKCTFN